MIGALDTHLGSVMLPRLHYQDGNVSEQTRVFKCGANSRTEVDGVWA